MTKQLFRKEDADFVSWLKACTEAKNLYTGAQVHAALLRNGLLETSHLAGDALVRMYARCGALLQANELLIRLHVQNVSSWNAIIAAFIQECQCQDALDCYHRMQHEGISPNTVTFSCVLKACARMQAIKKGEQVHNDIAKQGLLGRDIVLGSALVDMYAKCGALMKAQEVLDRLPKRNAITWTALISGFASHGYCHDALRCFEQMQHEGLSPDAVTFLSILKACSSIKAVELGKKFHNEIVKRNLFQGNNALLSALVDMYAKCGALVKARQVLENSQAGDICTWSALINGYVEQGQGEEALEAFEEMKKKGISPNTATFASILKVCGSIGASDKGEQIEEEIKQRLLQNDVVLGSALLDMHAKCGALLKARQVHDQLSAHDVISWTTLLAGYTLHGRCREVLSCFEQMQLVGLSPTEVTFICVLSACSHSGLVDEGQMYFASMSTEYGILPMSEHYTCMVDLFGRAGHLDKAVSFLEKMSSDNYPIVWRALLRACHNRQDVNVGKWAFEKALQIDKSNLALFDLMSNINLTSEMQANVKHISIKENG